MLWTCEYVIPVTNYLMIILACPPGFFFVSCSQQAYHATTVVRQMKRMALNSGAGISQDAGAATGTDAGSQDYPVAGMTESNRL